MAPFDDAQKKIVSWALMLLLGGAAGMGARFLGGESHHEEIATKVRTEMKEIVHTQSPYIEDRKLIRQQFESVDRTLDGLQNELRAIRGEMTQLRELIRTSYTHTHKEGHAK